MGLKFARGEKPRIYTLEEHYRENPTLYRAFKFWRLKVLETNSATRALFGTTELQLFSDSGINLARGAGIVSSSGHYGGETWSKPENAFDGSVKTGESNQYGWIGRDGYVAGEWIQKEFPEPITVTSYGVGAYGELGGRQQYALKAWQLLASNNGSGWEVIHSTSWQIEWRDDEVRKFAF